MNPPFGNIRTLELKSIHDIQTGRKKCLELRMSESRSMRGWLDGCPFGCTAKGNMRPTTERVGIVRGWSQRMECVCQANAIRLFLKQRQRQHHW